MAQSPSRRRRRIKPDAEIVLICNPRAGGRWKALASILDSEEAQYTRRIVTDSVDDIASAVSDLGHDAKLICVYGGDGTIQRVLDRMKDEDLHHVQLGLLGGGTMNVTSRWLGFGRSPGQNFRYIVNNYRSGDLLFKDVPLLEVRAGDVVNHGFTFGMGPIVRLLDAFERGKKGKMNALALAAKAASAAWLKTPSLYRDLLALLHAEVRLDGELLPHDEFAALFANTTGQINPGVVPFVDERSRDGFLCAAYAVSAREFALTVPFLIRGWLPIDVSALFAPTSLLKGVKEPSSFPTDPRYINRTATHLTVVSSEPIYTVDGELLTTDSNTIHVGLGPTLRLAVGPQAAIEQAWRLAKQAVKKR